MNKYESYNPLEIYGASKKEFDLFYEKEFGEFEKTIDKLVDSLMSSKYIIEKYKNFKCFSENIDKAVSFDLPDNKV